MRISAANAFILCLSLVISACAPVVQAASLPLLASTATPTATLSAATPTPTLPAATATARPTATPPPGSLAWPNLNDPSGIVSDPDFLRSGPGAEYPVVMTALGGMNFNILGKSADGKYWQVRLPLDIVPAGTGWILVDRLYARNVEQVAAVAAPPLIPGLGLAISADTPSAAAQVTINLRIGPGFEYPVIGFALRGETFPITGRSTDGLWQRLRVPFPISADGNAWVYSANTYSLNTSQVPVIGKPLPPWISDEQAGPACPLMSNSLLTKNTFRPSEYFTVQFDILNNTAGPWSVGDIDVAYLAALNNRSFRNSPERMDIVHPVEVGQTYHVEIDGQAWDIPGFYREIWAMANGDDTVCLFYVDIWVVKPQ